MKEPVPIFGQGFFTVSRRGDFFQIVRYDYHDPEGYYYKVVKRPKTYYEELNRLYYNMQTLLDGEVVKINGSKVRPRVKSVNIEHSGFEDYPHITFLIYFKGNLKRGENVYENLYEGEVADYDYEVYWFFPPRTRVLEVEISGDYDLVGEVLYIWVRRGDKINGYEKISFEFY